MHLFNLKQKLKGKPIVSVAEFEQLTGEIIRLIYFLLFKKNKIKNNNFI